MSAKTERNAQAYEQITAILTAAGKSMTAPEIAEHAMFRPLDANTRSLGQWLKAMVSRGEVSKRGRGSRSALYALAVPKSRAVKVAGDSVIIRIRPDGQFHSVKAPAGVTVELELAA